MSWEIVKVILTAILIVAVSIVAKKSTYVAAFMASLPIISVLALIWMSVDGHSNESLQNFSYSVLYLLPPSLIFFIVFPFLLKLGWPKLIVFALATSCTTGVYLVWIRIFKLNI